MKRFLSGMHGLSKMSAPCVISFIILLPNVPLAHCYISAFDLSRFNHWVDLGGGTGALVVVSMGWVIVLIS